MWFIVSVLSLMLFHMIRDVSSSSECHSSMMIWMYYPCSFIISSSSSYQCQQSSISVSIDQCLDRELMFFWHFPMGNMTITLESNEHQPFRLQFFEQSIMKRKLIKNVYHVLQDGTIIDGDQTRSIVSNDRHQYSMKFETFDGLLFDYGTFIRMTIIIDP